MSQPPSPEAYQEPLKENPFGATVRNLIEDAPHFNTTQLTRLVGESFVKEITAAAEQGEFFSQFKDEATQELATHVYSAEDIFTGQIAAALEAQDMHPKDPNEWKVHIPRSNGLREAIMVVMQDRRLSEPFRYAVYHKQAELLRNKDMQAAGIETELSSELREKVEEELGEEAVEASGVELEAAAASRIVSLEAAEAQLDPFDYLRTALPPLRKPAGPSKVSHGRHVSMSEEEARRDYYERFVTEENRQAAQTMLSVATSSTPEISDILSEHGLSTVSIEAVDAIREDPEVRYEVAKALVQKLDTLLEDGTNDMGLRINKDDPGNLKADPMRQRKLSSRLYTVDMALKMIGGEFAERLEGKNDLLRDEVTGRVVNGQHRHAARKLLLSQIK